MSGNTTNLGNQAQTNILIASTQVRSANFSQPYRQVGTAAIPVATASQAYVAGITKYVFYYPLTTATAINIIFTLTGFPAGFFATNSAVTQTTCVPQSAFSTVPLLSANHQFTDTVAATFNVNPQSSASPVFTGTAFMKVVIQFTLD
jgi:hypothetical protein